MRIGVIGRGFVGGSIEKMLRERSTHHVESFDAKDGDLNIGFERVVRESEIIYVAVPTPMMKSGKCFTGIIEGALKLIDFYKDIYHSKSPIVLIKSTMSPGTSDMLREMFPELIIVTNPEFLTERNAFNDLIAAKKHVIGISNRDKTEVAPLLERYHSEVWPDSSCIFVSNIEAELIKYLMNSYLAVRVAFANQIYHLCEALDLDYSSFIEAAKQTDDRIGKSHWQVPGIDGELGFGGKCFPKDLNGMITLFKELGVDCPLLESAWTYNLKIRGDKDWERIEGAQIDSE